MQQIFEFIANFDNRFDAWADAWGHWTYVVVFLTIYGATIVLFRALRLAPGLRFFHQGQFEGRKKRISPHLGRGPSEPVVEELRDFYDRHLVGQFFPPDVEFTPVSRTVDEHQVVDEMVISFTHTRVIDFMLPGVAPTGRRVEAAFVVIVGVADGKVTHEHIYWDQASVLVQLGLLDPTGLPVTGAEQSRLVLDPSREYRTEY